MMMLRKTLMILAGAASVGLLAPGVAQARGGFGGHGMGGGGHFGGFHGGGFGRGVGFGLGGFGLGVGLGYGLYGGYGPYGYYGGVGGTDFWGALLPRRWGGLRR